MICRKYHRNTGYLLRNVDGGTQEITGTGNCVNDGQTRQTDELQLMRSCQVHTSQPHKRITLNEMTSRPRMEMTNDVLGYSRATQVHTEYLRLIIYQKYVQVDGLHTSKLLVNTLVGENSSQQTNKKC